MCFIGSFIAGTHSAKPDRIVFLPLSHSSRHIFRYPSVSDLVKQRDVAIFFMTRHLKGRDAPSQVLRQITLAIQCRAQLAFGEDDESGGDLAVQAEALLDRLVGAALCDGPWSHLLCIEHGI